MKVLIIEDDHYKLVQISEFTEQSLVESDITSVRSIHSAKQKIRELQFELIILDMSLPSYDYGKAESGGTPEALGGRELLGYMDFYDVNSPVIVITQFEKFEQGDEEMDLSTLGAGLGQSYPNNYRGIIFFESASDAWKVALSKSLREIFPNNYQSSQTSK